MASITIERSEKYESSLKICSLLGNVEDMISNIIHTSCDRIVRPKVVDTTVFPLFVVGNSLNDILAIRQVVHIQPDPSIVRKADLDAA